MTAFLNNVQLFHDLDPPENRKLQVFYVSGGTETGQWHKMVLANCFIAGYITVLSCIFKWPFLFFLMSNRFSAEKCLR